MRTQLILTTAALGLASLGASAQVYSVNAVGYINIDVPAGNKLVMVANQLNNGDNMLSTVMPSPELGTLVYTYSQAGGFATCGFEGIWLPDAKVEPGAGFFMSSPVAQKVTLVGEVPQGALSTSLGAGLNLVSSKVPQAGGLETDLKYAPSLGDIVYQWDSANQKYADPISFEGIWLPQEPAIKVAEGFFLAKGAAGKWDRNFSVNN